MTTTDFKITTIKTGAGHFTVIVFDNNKREEKGTFETADMQLIDDISEVNGGDEDELRMHETFEEVIETCLYKLS